MDRLRERLIGHINRKDWWHVPPRDPQAYRKRGKFYASSFKEAEFWGRPLNEPLRVTVANPLAGHERRIERHLFGKVLSRRVLARAKPGREWMEARWALDARMKSVALTMGYDAIVLMHPGAFEAYERTDRMPRSIELNILEVPV